MPPDPLLALTDRLASARTTALLAKTAVAVARQAWESDHADLLESQAGADEQVRLSDAALREAVLAAFRATGDVAPAPGCKVVQRTVLDYAPPAALAWAKESGLALTLDVKAFEKIAKATPIPGVTVRQEPSVTVATDLNAALIAATSPTPKE